MPYEITFTKSADVHAAAARVLPALRQRFGEDLRADGGRIAFEDGGVFLAIEIAGSGERFTIRLTSKKSRFGVFKRIEDLPQLEEVKRIVAGEIAEWTGKLPDVVPR